MKLRNKKTGEIREARIADGHFQLWSTIIETWNDFDDLEYLAKWWERYEEPKEYWYMSNKGDIRCITDEDTHWDNDRKEIGNYFATKEEAEKAVEKLKAWQRLKDKGFEIENWTNNIGDNYYKTGDVVLNLNNVRNRDWNPVVQISEIKNELDLLFGGEE